MRERSSESKLVGSLANVASWASKSKVASKREISNQILCIVVCVVLSTVHWIGQ